MPHRVPPLLFAAVLLAATVSYAADPKPPARKMPPGDGADLAVGGPGAGRGTLSGVQSIAFDDKNTLYVLDWGWNRRVDGKSQMTGNSLVQKFDADGKFRGEFPIPDLGDKHAPTRLAVDSAGRVYITQPKAGVVQQLDPGGKLLKAIPVPGAFAVTVRKVGMREEVIVIPSVVGRGGKPEDVTAAVVIDPATGDVKEPLALGRAVRNAHAVAADRAGNLFVQADVNQVYHFDTSGKLLTVLGAGTSTRAEDGSELLHSVAVDSTGRLYAMSWGNPGLVTRFDAGFGTVTQRGGQFKWADPWSTHSGYVCLAVDRNDRLWVGVTGQHDPAGPNFDRYHPRPVVVRTDPKFFDTQNGAVVQRDAQLLGLRAEVGCDLPYRIAYDLKPVETQLVVKAGNRRVHDLAVRYQVFDMYRTEVATGTFDLKLEDGVEARHAVRFTPPKFGWYTVAFELSSGGKRLTAVGGHVGVTPRFPGMPALAAGESPGGWDDAPRWAFCGHNVMRLHPTEKNLDKLADDLGAAARYGVTVVAQLSSAKEANAEFVRAAVSRFKGKIAFWEIWNEPNFAMPGEKYAALVAELTPLVKSIDPAAKVLGPTVCGINLPWHEAFYKAGGGKHVDILSIHDYEGHESIDPVHWAWKVGALRKLMAEHGDGAKPIWQTERAISGVRGGCFLGSSQAVRVTLHRDVLETLGIPSEHNILYYLNEGGYTTVPSYVWSKVGPHPAALALRTRQAMIGKRTYAGTLDFGPTGNKIVWGLRYRGRNDDSGDTVTLRNLGTLDRPVDFTVTGDSVEVVDAFGNTRTVPTAGGKVRLTATQMPQYLRLSKGQDVTPVPIDFGKNVAAEATVTFSGESSGNFADLTNGIMEVIHAGHPHGGIQKPPIFKGQMGSEPQTLEVKFPQVRTVSKMLVFGLRADNNYCALLDYDLEYHDGTGWAKLAEVRTPCPPSDAVETPQCHYTTWYLDNHFFVHEFGSVKTDPAATASRRRRCRGGYNSGDRVPMGLAGVGPLLPGVPHSPRRSRTVPDRPAPIPPRA